jgi:hypothetical protein
MAFLKKKFLTFRCLNIVILISLALLVAEKSNSYAACKDNSQIEEIVTIFRTIPEKIDNPFYKSTAEKLVEQMNQKLEAFKNELENSTQCESIKKDILATQKQLKQFLDKYRLKPSTGCAAKAGGIIGRVKKMQDALPQVSDARKIKATQLFLDITTQWKGLKILKGEDPKCSTQIEKINASLQEAELLLENPSPPLMDKLTARRLEPIITRLLSQDPTLTNLEFTGNPMGPEGLKELSEALKKNSTLIRLSFSGNRIGDVGVSYLAEALKTNKTLQSLNLLGNRIGPIGASHLAEALKSNDTLQSLILSRNKIEDMGAFQLGEALKSNKALQNLLLMECYIGDAGSSQLGEGLKNNNSLRELYLNNNLIGNIGVSTLGEALKRNISLRYLNLENNAIGDDGVSQIAEGLKSNKTLQELYMPNNKIGVVGKKSLQILQQERHLYLKITYN